MSRLASRLRTHHTAENMPAWKPGESGNPKGRAKRQARGDGWQSVVTALGSTRDKRSSVYFKACIVPDVEAIELWRGDDLAARGIETYPDEMLRAGYDVSIGSDEDGADDAREQGELIDEALKALGTDEMMRDAMCKENALGGAAIWPVMNDQAGSLVTPLDETRIVEVKRLVVFEPRELEARTFYEDPTVPEYGMPETYWLRPITPSGLSLSSSYGVPIHASRLIVFPGIRVSRQQSSQYQGWGDSVLNRMYAVLRDFNMGFSGASALLADFAQAVYSIRGLYDAVTSGEEGAAQIKARIMAMELGRSIVNAILLDAGDEVNKPETFDRKQTPMAGLPETLQMLVNRLAAAMDVPVTELMGTSAQGMNATGEGDRLSLHARAARKQDRHLRPRLERLIKLIMLSKTGPTRGKVPDQWCVEFRPLSTPSEKESADTRLVQAQVDEKYVALGAPVDDILKSRFGGDGYSTDTKIDFDGLDAQLEAEAERASAQATMQAAVAATPAQTPAETPPAAKE